MDLGNSVELVKTGFIKGRNLEIDRKCIREGEKKRH